eukprot:TRINITY_DN13981_c0_g1_i1.p1 TRINITY_DN13981_c0_g1~~TRINITY_DN13981_c0_g1_i1.p1  ORF type:complete len:434 (+),score=125.97 TRINITY_DN13981_c0_g1_i1:18-1319(+)
MRTSGRDSSGGTPPGGASPLRERSPSPSPSRFSDVVEPRPSANVLTQPHTVSILLVAISIMLYEAFSRDPSTHSIESNTKAGILAAIACFLLFSVLQMRDGLFVRPHRAVWRLVMGAAVLYLLFLVFLLFQSRDDARALLKYIDPKLGVYVEQPSYAGDCRVYTPEDPVSNFRNIYDTATDHFMLAHLLGWWGKTLVLRDVGVCWSLSIFFELLEYSLKHWLPNFAECWWDHLILDILVCNGLGIYLGNLTCRYLSMKEYDWAGMGRTKRVILRSITQFSPEKYDLYQWKIFSSPKRVLYVVVLVIMWATVELNTFFLKFSLWIPPPHPLVIGRLVLWWCICFPCMREYYQFVTDPRCKKFGTMAWLATAIFSTETLINIKFSEGLYPKPTPPHIFWGWVAAISIFVVWFAAFSYTKYRSLPPKVASPHAHAD